MLGAKYTGLIHSPLIIRPYLKASGISEAFDRSSSDFLCDSDVFGLIRASVAGLLEKLSGDGIEFPVEVIHRTACACPLAFELHE